MAKHTTISAGIDTGKRKLDIAIDGRAKQLQVNNTAHGHEKLIDWLRQHRVKRIGIEASGGYERAVVAALRRNRFVVVVFQPAQVRAYPRACGQCRNACAASERHERLPGRRIQASASCGHTWPESHRRD